MEFLKKIRFLNGNTLKLLAALFMFIDHFSMIYFPETSTIYWVFRAIGRLSMPLFAFAIAEGCRYTRNKIKHFFMLFVLGVLCQIVYFIFDPNTLYFGILFTFSFAILCIYALQYLKKQIFDNNAKTYKKVLASFLFIFSISATYVFCYFFQVDYGFWGCMMPVFAALFDFHRIPAPHELKKLDVLPLKVICLGIALIFLIYTNNSPLSAVTPYALLTLPILLLYNGEKGKRSMKYFFYIFYPAHLGLLEGVYMAVMLLK